MSSSPTASIMVAPSLMPDSPTFSLPNYPISETNTPPFQAVPHAILTPVDLLKTIPPTVTVHPTALVDATATLGDGVIVEAYCIIGANVTVGANTHLLPHTILAANACIGQSTLLGPFLHVRENVSVGSHCKIGNFVELKNATVADSTCVSHLAYIGDATLGEWVNIGAGTITANFNSLTGAKTQTVIEDFASIGANCTLVAPVTVGRRAMVAAGSVITKPVSDYSLAIARGKQTEVTDWVQKQLNKLSTRNA
jgi:bifunctional UDP-N-acetylglucosamine pyrophosphorylase / glucosamine-1-phosphate N-acetyltransferase